MTLILFALATVGLTNVLVHGKILELLGVKPFLRKYMKPDWFSLFECYECSGFWAGMVCGFLVVAGLSEWPIILACGWAGSVLAATYNTFIFWLNSKVEFEVGDEHGSVTTEKSA